MIVFEYRKEKSTITGNILRPIASVKFKSKENTWIELRLYIDSGADITLIPLSFGRLLGLELKKEDIKRLTGVGGTSIPVVITEVEIKISEPLSTLKGWSLLLHRIPTGFFTGLQSDSPCPTMPRSLLISALHMTEIERLIGQYDHLRL